MDYYFKKEVCFDLLIILMRNCMKMCDFIDILIVCLSRSVLLEFYSSKFYIVEVDIPYLFLIYWSTEKNKPYLASITVEIHIFITNFIPLTSDHATCFRFYDILYTGKPNLNRIFHNIYSLYKRF